MTDKTGSDLAQILLERRLPTRAIAGPQEAVITSVTGTGAATSCYFLVPKVSADFKYGPAPCPAGATVGQRALAVFVGNGVGDPWIVAVTTVPKPDGF